jgi:methionine-R-sulfoxide reductase
MTMRSTLFVALCTASIVALGAACGAHAGETEAVMDNTPRPIRTAKPTEAELRKELTRVQYLVTQEADTEPPFHNAYWDNHKAGLYVDITTGQPLFTSNEKFDSGTGWPSFWAPVDKGAVSEHDDRAWFMRRTEVRCASCDAHLGHVFPDGPKPTGARSCMNGVALKFAPDDGEQR